MQQLHEKMMKQVPYGVRHDEYETHHLERYLVWPGCHWVRVVPGQRTRPHFDSTRANFAPLLPDGSAKMRNALQRTGFPETQEFTSDNAHRLIEKELEKVRRHGVASR